MLSITVQCWLAGNMLFAGCRSHIIEKFFSVTYGNWIGGFKQVYELVVMQRYYGGTTYF